ncbi:protein MRG1 isoform X2 [Punica granatum]|uniref:Protein MRG1 isoform X2 n=1 Tax=Punica granatum TaxID=22663 RepID=A0A6P8DKV5_PUNGR|nr:protein MRG1 isoform X2 [Punica granatum]
MGNSSKDGSGGGSGGDNSSGRDPPTRTFSEGEKVLAYHGPRIYEAKVQKTEVRKNEWRYFVHYLGWNKNWDEWVGADRLLKYTEENIMKQQALEKKQGIDRNPKSGRLTQHKPKISAATKGKKRKNDAVTEKDNVVAEKLVKIQIPSTLKKQLVDDWEFITQRDKLVKLPRSPTVDDILTSYLEHKSKKDATVTDSVGEVLKGLRCYFDKALPAMLLYRKERQQYKEAVAATVSPSTIYGAEHLLRLFVKLPELLVQVNIEEETLTRLQQKLVDFLKFLQKNQSTFFLSAYEGFKASEGKGKRKEDRD